MMVRTPNLHLPRVMPDSAMLLAAASLLGIGLVMVASSSIAIADRLTGAPLYFFYRQTVYTLAGILAAADVVHVPMRLWQRNSFALLAAGLCLLGLVLVAGFGKEVDGVGRWIRAGARTVQTQVPGIGNEVNGARRWIGAGALTFQASEPVRLCILLYVAAYASRRQAALVTTWGGLFRPMLIVLSAAVLLLLEPDFGAAVVLMSV